ncbi:MAG: CBS and ACT domain-containing protein [Thermodesulfobacteriota bacterium]
MLIQDWMAKDVLTVDENTSLMRATRIMKENGIRRLPVVGHGKLTGIVTDRDVKDASPSKNTSLDVHELYYLLSEMKVKEVMTPSPVILRGHDSLEKAAVIMLEKKISGVPIVATDDTLEGLLSETDVLRGFIHSTGIKDGAIQFVFDLDDRPGSVTEVIQNIREMKAQIISVLTSFEDGAEGLKRVGIRVMPEDGCNCEELTKHLTDNFSVVYHGMDDLA